MKKVAWAVAVGMMLSSGFCAARADARARLTLLNMEGRAPLMRVEVETRLPEGADAERVEMPPRALRAGERYVIAGRLARVTLVATPWEGRRWQVRYRIEPGGDANSRSRSSRGAGGRQSDSGVFKLDEDTRTEFWTSAPGALHGLRVQLGDTSRRPSLPPREPSRLLLGL